MAEAQRFTHIMYAEPERCLGYPTAHRIRCCVYPLPRPARAPSPGTPAGLDVASLLSQVGLQVTDTSEKVGTFAIAYAAHKALSPVRFPPTVALTPLVAKYIGSKKAAPPPADGKAGDDGKQ